MIDLVGDQGRDADGREVAGGRRPVAVFDQFDGGANRADRAGGLRQCARPGRQILCEADCDFAFDPWAAQVCPAQFGAGRVQIFTGHETGDRPVKAEICLHLAGRGADLEACWRVGVE